MTVDHSCCAASVARLRLSAAVSPGKRGVLANTSARCKVQLLYRLIFGCFWLSSSKLSEILLGFGWYAGIIASIDLSMRSSNCSSELFGCSPSSAKDKCCSPSSANIDAGSRSLSKPKSEKSCSGNVALFRRFVGFPGWQLLAMCAAFSSARICLEAPDICRYAFPCVPRTVYIIYYSLNYSCIKLDRIKS